MAILSDEKYLTPTARASDLLHLDDNFWAAAFASVIDDG